MPTEITTIDFQDPLGGSASPAGHFNAGVTNRAAAGDLAQIGDAAAAGSDKAVAYADHVHKGITLDADLASALLALSAQALDLNTQTANYVFAGPASGAVAKPGFRALVDADIPDLYTYKATLTTQGDIYYASGASTPARLAIGTADQVLSTDGTDPVWRSVAAVPSILVAANDATTGEKNAAGSTYTGDGTADEEQIQAAIDALA